MRVNNNRTAQMLKFIDSKDQKVLRPAQRGKVAFLVEMTDGTAGKLNELASELMEQPN